MTTIPIQNSRAKSMIGRSILVSAIMCFTFLSSGCFSQADGHYSARDLNRGSKDSYWSDDYADDDLDDRESDDYDDDGGDDSDIVMNPEVKKDPSYIVVNNDFSNLQVYNPRIPIYDQYTLEQRRALNLPTQLPPVQKFSGIKMAYLTFDDGPDDINTPRILDILKMYGVIATFFVCGNMVDTYPSVLKRIFNEGHAIGNHSYNHNYKQLYPSASNFLYQMEKTDEAIFDVIGMRPLIIRAPGGKYGAFTSEYYPMLDKNGYVEYDWNVDSEDAKSQLKSAQALIDQVDQQTQKKFKNDSAIILMHSTAAKTTTVDALPKIIQILKERGYMFGVITPMTPQPW